MLESDGYLLTHFKAYYNGLYGTLTFVEDHGVQQHCDAVGHGDSGIYPGAAVETGQQRPAGHRVPLQPGGPVLRPAPQHGGVLRDQRQRRAASTTTGSTTTRSACRRTWSPARATRATRATRCSSRTTVLLEQLQRLRGGLDASIPAFPFPVGTGLWIAGGNRHQVRDNYFYDNWRRGTMLFSVPDQLSAARPPAATSRRGATPTARRRPSTTASTTTTWACGPTARPTRTARTSGGTPTPGTIGNCWWNNIPAEGARDHLRRWRELRGGAFPDCDNGDATRTRASGRATPRRPASSSAAWRRSRPGSSTRTGPARGSRPRPSRSPAEGASRRGPESAFDRADGDRDAAATRARSTAAAT